LISVLLVLFSFLLWGGLTESARKRTSPHYILFSPYLLLPPSFFTLFTHFTSFFLSLFSLSFFSFRFFFFLWNYSGEISDHLFFFFLLVMKLEDLFFFRKTYSFLFLFSFF